jgi:hypothetical protein
MLVDLVATGVEGELNSNQRHERAGGAGERESERERERERAEQSSRGE